jgi:hypothetical protein
VRRMVVVWRTKSGRGMGVVGDACSLERKFAASLAESIAFEPEVAFVACNTVARLKPQGVLLAGGQVMGREVPVLSGSSSRPFVAVQTQLDLVSEVELGCAAPGEKFVFVSAW